MKTKQTETDKQLRQHLSSIESRVDKLTNRLDSIKPIKGHAQGVTRKVDMETKRKMAAQAQFLNLNSPEELAQIVLNAFLKMCEDEPWITFPLMLQQVETV